DFVLISEDTLPLMPDRAPDVHKGQVGRIFVIGGSADMPGAPLLCAYAALRCGSGLVTVTQLEKASAAYIAPEIILKRLEGDSGYLELFHLVAFKEEIIKAACVVLGPGLGRQESTRAFVRETVDVLSGLGKFVVLDADALNLLSDTRGLIEGFDLSSAVLTPHPGEAARLLNWPISRVQEDRYRAASELHKMSGAAAIVLKGASTIIYGVRGGLVNLSGNPYMATAGSGDVLSGVIASLIGQGLDPFDAAVLGVHVHSRAGDSAHARSGGPIVASDFISYLPTVIFDRNCVEINFF
ncbi:MAG: NAD(P)H-hydrate dehydratase, partial [SAR324 cluster bacterium]|nr:NAD(P)H-hydrate dehydratase [SAR324 cluster bacterium]